MRTLAATLFAVLAFCSPAFASSVTNVTVDNSAPSSAAGARTSYVVSFKATNGIAASGRVTVTFPAAAAFEGWAGGTIVAGGTQVGNCGSPNNAVVQCSLFTGQTVATGATVTVTLNGVRNPGNGANTLSVSTTVDADAVNAQFALTAAGTLSQVIVDNSTPSPATGARTRYLASFKVSAGGGLSQQANSRIDVVFPPGTSFLGYAGASVTVGGTQVGNCGSPSNGAIQCSLFTGETVAAGATVNLAFNGITNTTDVGQRTISVDTTSDTALTPSAAFTVTAANPVTGVNVVNASPSAAAGARTRYVISFTTSATGGLSNAANSHIQIPFQSGTTFAGWAGGTISAGGQDVGNCGAPNGLLLDCSLFTNASIPPSTQVTMTLTGVSNPDTPSTATKLSVNTTSDPALVFSQNFTVLPANALTNVTVANAAPSAAAGARTQYVVRFTTSATGGLSNGANSRLDFTFPAGTTFPGWAGGTINVAGAAVGNCGAPNGLAVQCSLFTNGAIAPSTAVEVAFTGVTNPTTPGADKAVSVSTTSDPGAVASAPFTVVPAGTLSAITAANANPSNAVGARTTFVVTLKLSATGALSTGGNSRLTFTFPTGTTFAGWTGSTIRDVTSATDIGNCGAPSGLNVTCSLFTNASAAAGDVLRVTFNGVANPTTTGTDKTVSVSTTSDPAVIASAPFSVISGGALTNVGVTAASLTPSASTTYVVRFTASATGGLSNAANSRMDFTFPTGTTFTGSSASVLDVTSGAVVGNCGAPNGLTVECGFFSNAGVAAGDELRTTFSSVTNPPTAGPYQLSVTTTSDLPATASASYAQGDTVAPDTTIDSGPTGPDPSRSFTFSSSEPGGTFECRVDSGPFTACTSPYTTPAQTAGAHTFGVRAVDAGGNPDPTPATRTFTITLGAPDTTITSGPSGTIGVTSAAFSFDSPDAGATFECALDGGFTPCTSPKSYSGLSEGAHTFSVRAVSAGVTDPTPATRTFTVATATPTPTPTATATATATATPIPIATTAPTPVPTATATPTPTPTPTPQAEFKQDVVVAPIEGTIDVCDKPGVNCRKLAAGTEVPLNKTIDARNGTVELSTVGADGKVETAKFYDGMFKVSQTATTTDLTLNEPLDCSKKGKQASVSAGKKKPKSRKLWGDGKGRFRTKGSYSAATVRGTKWLVQDTCTSTLTRVAQGVVSVRDNVRGKTVTLRAGKSYTAKRR
ncbi:beta strand repeat-containing protein [Solirubrobacter soli]|uniref:beta strand repeat-containing protein n=1 Tax=Solirubrobacter soli TaxID=363832 RepID=UPI00048A2B76|nr:hypothetical protein [Solirubrobacter soli]